MKQVDYVFMSANDDEAWDVTLLPVEGGEPLVVRVDASDAVAASLKASYQLQKHWGVVATAGEAKKVDWVALVDAWAAEQRAAAEGGETDG